MKIQDNVMIPSGVTIADGVFIGPSVSFTNDKYPRAINKDGTLKKASDWNVSESYIEHRPGTNLCLNPDSPIKIVTFAVVIE